MLTPMNRAGGLPAIPDSLRISVPNHPLTMASRDNLAGFY